MKTMTTIIAILALSAPSAFAQEAEEGRPYARNCEAYTQAEKHVREVAVIAFLEGVYIASPANSGYEAISAFLLEDGERVASVAERVKRDCYASLAAGDENNVWLLIQNVIFEIAESAASDEDEDDEEIGS